MLKALLFDESAAREVGLEAASDLSPDRLLWVEVDGADTDELRSIGSAFGLEAEIWGQLEERAKRATVHDSRSHLHVTLLVPGADGGAGDLVQVDCLVGEGWLVTVVPDELETIDEFREHVTGTGQLGGLDAPSFLAALLEWAIEGYLTTIDAVEDELEQVDVAAMRLSDGDDVETTLDKLVELRRRTGRLRRALGGHRQVLSTLAHPEFDPISTDESAARFERVVGRLDQALTVADGARNSVLGSFELMIARSGQRTNDIMKVLTLVSVLLLPTTALAGVMGMNFKVGLFQVTWAFWVVIGVMGLFAVATITAARLRRWI